MPDHDVGPTRPAVGSGPPVAAAERVYRVSWLIDISAAAPAEAARRALAIQRRPGSTATVFQVEWTDTLGDACGTEVTHRVQIDFPDAPAPPGVGCGTCNDVRWLPAMPDGDISRAWVDRCDDCGNDRLDDDQAADLAATQLGTRIGHDTIGGGTRPYLVGLTFAETHSRWIRLVTAGAPPPTSR